MKNKLLICLFLSIVLLLVILIIYKNSFRNEAFSNPPSAYDNGKVYSVGDVVIQDRVVYIMKDRIGAAGYAPPRPTNWAPLPSANLCSPVEYDNGTVYKVGDLVSKNEVIYVMIDGIGAAGYAPPRPTNWTPVSPESIRTLCVTAAPVTPAVSTTPAVSLQNPNLVLNTSTGGPAWGQQTVDKSLVPSSIVIGNSYNAGRRYPITITTSDKGAYVSNNTYTLGDVVTLAGLTYLNLGWNKDTRGCPAYCGTYNQNPTVDTFAWKPVTIAASTDPTCMTGQFSRISGKPCSGSVDLQNLLRNTRFNTEKAVDKYLSNSDSTSCPSLSPRAAAAAAAAEASEKASAEKAKHLANAIADKLANDPSFSFGQADSSSGMSVSCPSGDKPTVSFSRNTKLNYENNDCEDDTSRCNSENNRSNSGYFLNPFTDT